MSRRAVPEANPAVHSTPMTPVVIGASAVAPQAWRNGGGQTRELFTWPAQGPWRLRISRADIDADGPFSAFPGVTRWFAVLQGRGVALTFDAQQCHVVRADGDALCFGGDRAPQCHLLDGPTQDLNLMAAGGLSVMARVQPDLPWNGPWAMRGLYTPVAGQWRSGQARCALDAHSLLWLETVDPGDWTFTPAPDTVDGGFGSGGSGGAWWLGFTPKE